MSAAFDSTTVDKWRQMWELFDRDQTKPNPYEEVDNRMYAFRDVSVCTDETQMSLWPN